MQMDFHWPEGGHFLCEILNHVCSSDTFHLRWLSPAPTGLLASPAPTGSAGQTGRPGPSGPEPGTSTHTHISEGPTCPGCFLMLQSFNWILVGVSGNAKYQSDHASMWLCMHGWLAMRVLGCECTEKHSTQKAVVRTHSNNSRESRV